MKSGRGLVWGWPEGMKTSQSVFITLLGGWMLEITLYSWIHHLQWWKMQTFHHPSFTKINKKELINVKNSQLVYPSLFTSWLSPGVSEGGLRSQERTLAALLDQASRIQRDVAAGLQVEALPRKLLESHILTMTHIVKQLSTDIQVYKWVDGRGQCHIQMFCSLFTLKYLLIIWSKSLSVCVNILFSSSVLTSSLLSSLLMCSSTHPDTHTHTHTPGHTQTHTHTPGHKHTHPDTHTHTHSRVRKLTSDLITRDGAVPAPRQHQQWTFRLDKHQWCTHQVK